MKSPSINTRPGYATGEDTLPARFISAGANAFVEDSASSLMSLSPKTIRRLGNRHDGSQYTPSNPAKQIVRIENGKGDFGAGIETASNGGGNIGAGLSAQAGLRVQLNDDAAQGSDFVRAWRNTQPNAELGVHQADHAVQIVVAGNRLDSRDQPLFLGLRQHQNAPVALGILQERFPLAGAGTGRALRTNGNLNLGGHDGDSAVKGMAGVAPIIDQTSIAGVTRRSH